MTDIKTCRIRRILKRGERTVIFPTPVQFAELEKRRQRLSHKKIADEVNCGLRLFDSPDKSTKEARVVLEFSPLAYSPVMMLSSSGG